MKILVTGCAGFIGFHLLQRLLNNEKYQLFGIDNLNNYYDRNLKKNRLKILLSKKNFNFFKINIRNLNKIHRNFEKYKYDVIIHLAAQAGVRYSIKNPRNYLDININGFFNIIDTSNKIKVSHFIYASTSSVYGNSKTYPLYEEDNTDRPLSFYAATKKCNEVFAHSFSNIYKLKTTGLRFFTVYGTYGRPDMSLFKFTDSIIKSKNVELFNNGKHLRDFTHIDDITISIEKLINKPSKKNIPFQVINIGGNKAVSLRKYLSLIESYVGKKAKIKYKPLQLGDVYKTQASNAKIFKLTNFLPKTPLEKGISEFIIWYKKYYKR